MKFRNKNNHVGYKKAYSLQQQLLINDLLCIMCITPLNITELSKMNTITLHASYIVFFLIRNYNQH